MTIEEKLEHFRESVLENARQKTYGELAKYTQGLDRTLKNHKQSEQAHREQVLAAQRTESRQISNRELAREQVACRRKLSACEKELTEKLIEEVLQLLAEAKKKPEYKQQLVRQIRSAAAFAKGLPVEVTIDPSDADLLPTLQKEAAADNVEIAVAEESFGGGTQAVIESMNIRIDNSFRGRFEEVREDFRLSHVL